MMILENLFNEINATLTGVTDVKFVDQDRGQYLNMHKNQRFGTPALFIKFNVNNIQQLIGKQYISVDIVISSVIKCYTKGAPIFDFYDLHNNVYKALQNQHYDCLTSPIIRTEIEFDDEVEEFYLGYSTYTTVIEDKVILDINKGNIKHNAEIRVTSDFDNPEQIKIDTFNTSGVTN